MKYYIGIDLGGTNLAVGLVDENALLLDKDSIPTRTGEGAGKLIEDMRAVTDRLLSRNALSLKEVEEIGIGVPGTANHDTGIIEYANNLGFYDTPFIAGAEEVFEGKKIYFDNDGNAAAWGEFLAGAGAGADSLVAVTLGTGVGGGIILNGSLYEGVNYAAGELGHMVINTDGIDCNCGRRGCFEAYASVTALISQTKAAMEKDKDSRLWELCSGDIRLVEGKTLFQGVRRGDGTAKEVLEKYITCLGAGLVNIINIFQPEILCIGGGISRAGELFLPPLKQIVRQESYSRTSRKQTDIVIAQLGNDAGIIGAALLNCKRK